MSLHLDFPQKTWESVDPPVQLTDGQKNPWINAFKAKAAACQLNEVFYGPFSTQIFFIKVSPLIPVYEHAFVKRKVVRASYYTSLIQLPLHISPMSNKKWAEKSRHSIPYHFNS